MKTKDKPIVFPTIERADLKAMSTEELQQRFDAFSIPVGAESQTKSVQDLLYELQVQQIELEMQSRELLESQRKLEVARDRYADLYDFAPVCYINFDATGCIREINLAGATLLGQEREQLLGKSFSLWVKRGDNVQAFFTHLNQAQESRQTESVELQLQPIKQAQLDVRLETVVSHEEFEGKPSFRCVIVDITEHKQAEREIDHNAQLLQLIIEAVPAYIAYIDHGERYRFINKAYANWFGKKQDEMIGRSIRDVVDEKLYAQLEKNIRTALAGFQANFEWNVQNMNGEEQAISASYIPDFADNGAVSGYFVISRDVTEQRKLEALEKMHVVETTRVARINTMGEMVSELAHELNQPLAAITIYSDAVSRMLNKGSTDNAEMTKALGEIRLQAERAGEVIRRLRDFVSKRELVIEAVELNQLVQEVLHLIRVEARWHETRVSLELIDEISLVGVDRILIEQVILNLARNAIEAMDVIEASKRILTIKTRLAYQDTVELVVEDTGPGIGKDELEKIFEPFYTSKAEGMGMGLAISRNIIKAHNGRLWAVPNEGGGTTFSFTLPLQQDN